jgi:hypothetical protein
VRAQKIGRKKKRKKWGDFVLTAGVRGGGSRRPNPLRGKGLVSFQDSVAERFIFPDIVKVGKIELVISSASRRLSNFPLIYNF